MAKTKTFAEKALKSLKPKEDVDPETGEPLVTYKVMKPEIGPKGTIRYVSSIVRVPKSKEAQVLGG